VAAAGWGKKIDKLTEPRAQAGLDGSGNENRFLDSSGFEALLKRRRSRRTAIRR
jgi:hypothetical protein